MVFQFNGAFLEFSVGQALFGDYDAKSLVVLPPHQVHDLILIHSDGFANLDFLGFGSVDVDLVIAIEELQQPLDFVPFGFCHASVLSMARVWETAGSTRWRLTPC